MIEEFLAAASLCGYILFLVKWRFSKYFGALGWICLVAMIFSDFPGYIHENNFAYPLIALVSLPALYATIKLLMKENATVNRVTQGAAFAFIIYAPFAYIDQLGNLLIYANVFVLQTILDLLGFSYSMPQWNIFMHDIFRVEIILGCTGIQAIAIMAGVIAAVSSTYVQKLISAFVVVFTVVIMNFIRNLFVIFAYTEQWFPYLPEIASNGQYGYESFFWAHNVISEFGLSLLTIIILLLALLKLNPDLKEFIMDIIRTYKKEFGIKSKKAFSG
ncbi:archaeosortase A (PGF-CTERM-specific) [Methanomicrobium sp. W14]|uniref:archaeosortase A n=1 Tax=Methanomicrobium sp. W14 TaxID=2817839 RepID=UPI001AE15A4F|nr:archaeosortase A [Methanomicrobium sp. W14]MBP2133249.1 archaeosortase A (PGF-CTERM-specific) [Methanomicrobium sp. W14]